jgi:hypothetical protein
MLRCRSETKYRTAITTAAFNKKTVFTRKMDLNTSATFGA